MDGPFGSLWAAILEGSSQFEPSLIKAWGCAAWSHFCREAYDVIRILLADGQELVGQVTRQMLDRQPDLEVVSVVSDGPALMKAVARDMPDVALVDISLPGGGGLAVTAQICALSPNTVVMLMTGYDEDVCAKAAIETGGCGCVLKDVRGGELVRAVRQAVALTPS